MKKGIATAILLIGALSACTEKANNSGPTQPGGASSAVDSGSIIRDTELKMFVSDAKVQNWPGIGLRKGNNLLSNGTNGYLMFGPKVPFKAGDYTVTINGDQLNIAADNSIILDATSNGGKNILGSLTLDDKASLTKGQPLATFDFSVPEDIKDLEIRVFTTSGSTIGISDYEVKAKNK